MKINKEDCIVGGSVFTVPKYAWKLTVGDGFNLFYYEGKQPNRFHRWMQKVFLGFKWEKIDENR